MTSCRACRSCNTGPPDGPRLHPLWSPALLPILSEAESADALRSAAAVHRAHGRLTEAVDLSADAADWDEVLVILREAQMLVASSVPADELGRWSRLLPSSLRQEPEILLAAGFACQDHAPLEAIAIFESAAAKFRSKGDIDGEMAAMGQNGLVRWWIKDFPGLFALHDRVRELAADGSARAEAILAIAMAGLGHLNGDSAQTLATLVDIDEDAAARWLPVVHWNRSVADRRSGDLWQARAELDGARDLEVGRFAGELATAELHIDWLEGNVDHVLANLPDLRARQDHARGDFLVRETLLELACKSAWVGGLELARSCLAVADDLVAGIDAPLSRTLRVIAAGRDRGG